MAALTLADQLTVEARWTPTTKNFADGPLRSRGPAPCGADLACVASPCLRRGSDDGLALPKHKRCALGCVAADVQRSRLVKDFETALLAGECATSQLTFAFRELF